MGEVQEGEELGRVTYASVLNANQTHDGRKRIRDVVQESKYRNLAKNISGMLFYDESTQSVVQIIEGPPDEVRKLLKRIYADQRHREICVLKWEKITRRKYPAGMWYGDKGAMHNALKSMDVGLIFTRRARGFRTLEVATSTKKTDADNLWQVAYTSKLTVSGPGSVVSKQLNKIMLNAQQNNAKLNISGALCFSPKSKLVFQVLEGPRVAMCSLFEAIQADCRHKSVKCLYSAPAKERAYPNFDMKVIMDYDLESKVVFERVISDLCKRPITLEPDGSTACTVS